MPVSREESGGVQGLRAWASDAVERVKRLVIGMGGEAAGHRRGQRPAAAAGRHGIGHRTGDGRPGKERTALRAAFSHQGHPGPGATILEETTAEETTADERTA